MPDHEVKILDLNMHSLSQNQLNREISKYDAIGVSLMSTTHRSVTALKWLKSARKNYVTSIVGGFFPRWIHIT
ncbi:MAG: hypothetical protein ACXQS8_00225 [Candidatus Helarchaeales archaeon]